jgi:23S rRNA (pseudouridine1915-N3)-methyltransferase
MDVVILAVGRLKSGPESELCARYLDRATKLGPGLGFQGWQVHEIRESRATETLARKAEEGAQIRAAVGGGRLVCLDERGEDLDSAGLADWLRGEADAGRARAVFAIGGADGLDPALAGAADRRVAFGRQTWPHQLVRIMLAEQLYRAMTILAGHPYHRA